MKLVLQKEPMQCKTQELHKQYYVQRNVFTIGLASPVPDIAIMADGLNYTLTLPPRCETIGFGGNETENVEIPLYLDIEA